MGIFNLEGEVEKQLIEVCGKIIKHCQNVTSSEIASMWLFDEKTQELVLIPELATNKQNLRKQIKERALVCYTFNTGEFVTTNDIRKEPIDKFGPIYDSSTENKTGIKIKSLISVPIQVGEEKRVGVIQAMNIREGVYSPYHNSILQLLATIAGKCIYDATQHKKIIDPSLELEEIVRMTSELNIIAKLQESTFPKIPKTKNFEIAVKHLPCQLIGGDWYEFKYNRKRENLGILIGDVASHGVGSAFVANSLLIKTRAFLHSADAFNPKKMRNLLIELNKEHPKEMHSTLAFAVLQPDGIMYYLSAGHHHPLIYSSSGKYLEMQIDTGLPLGAALNRKQFNSFLPKPSQHYIEEKGLCVFYTDGLIEARSPGKNYNQFGTKRLIKTLSDNFSLPLDMILEKVNYELRNFSGTHYQKHDDVLAIVIRRKT